MKDLPTSSVAELVWGSSQVERDKPGLCENKQALAIENPLSIALQEGALPAPCQPVLIGLSWRSFLHLSFIFLSPAKIADVE